MGRGDASTTPDSSGRHHVHRGNRLPLRSSKQNQFTSRVFLNFCEEMGIKVCFASVSYPTSNGQVERANAEVLKGLKTKAFDKLEKKGKSGLITYQAYYGHSEQHQAEPLETHPSSSSTEQKMSCHQNSSTNHPGCSHIVTSQYL